MNQARVLVQLILLTAIGTLFVYPNSAPLSASPRPEYGAATTSLVAEWSFKRDITIENRGDEASDAVVQLWFTDNAFDYTNAKPNGADIRFSTGSGKPDGDGLPYWIEQWNEQGVSRIWVRVPVLKAHGTTTIRMYYGNAGAQAASDGNTTFLFFDDFEDGDYPKKWTNTSIGDVVERDGLLKLKETDGQDGIITANFEVTGPLIIRTLYQRGGGDEHWTRAGVGGWSHWLCFGDHTDNAATGTNYVMLFDKASLNSLTSAPLVKSANTVITDQWRRVAYWYDGQSLRGKQDDVTVALPMPNASSKLTLRTLDNDHWDSFAYISVSAYLGAEPVVTMGKQEVN